MYDVLISIKRNRQQQSTSFLHKPHHITSFPEMKRKETKQAYKHGIQLNFNKYKRNPLT